MPTNNQPPSALIVGCSGPVLSETERHMFSRLDPLGFILFGRNVDTPEQVRALVRALRDSVGRADAPVLIDQEGGRVQRLGPPHWRKVASAAPFAALAGRDLAAAREALRLNFRLIGHDLAQLGIDVDCAPVLDVPVTGAHDVIGDRAYGVTAARVVALAREAAEGLLDQAVVPVIKHIPGHGRATIDSHVGLPVVTATAEELEESDFAAFRAFADAPWAMTAHVVYTAFDLHRPATVSPVMIGEVIRRRLGFDGVLVSDDLSMKALGGRFEDRASSALNAGCDVLLHCNGDMEEMAALGRAVRPLSDQALDRLERARAMKRVPRPIDVAQAVRRLDELLAPVAHRPGGQ